MNIRLTIVQDYGCLRKGASGSPCIHPLTTLRLCSESVQRAGGPCAEGRSSGWLWQVREALRGLAQTPREGLSAQRMKILPGFQQGGTFSSREQHPRVSPSSPSRPHTLTGTLSTYQPAQLPKLQNWECQDCGCWEKQSGERHSMSESQVPAVIVSWGLLYHTYCRPNF